MFGCKADVVCVRKTDAFMNEMAKGGWMAAAVTSDLATDQRIIATSHREAKRLFFPLIFKKSRKEELFFVLSRFRNARLNAIRRLG